MERCSECGQFAIFVEPQRVLKRDGLELDTVFRTCTVNGCDVHLSPMETRTLEILMERAPRTMSLFDLVDSLDSTDAAVKVYISRLRHKLGAERIETFRGACKLGENGAYWMP